MPHLTPPTQFIIIGEMEVKLEKRLVSIYARRFFAVFHRAPPGRSCDQRGRGSEKMATVGEEKGWTFDAFDSGTLRKY